jgi:competence protein ComEC
MQKRVPYFFSAIVISLLFLNLLAWRAVFEFAKPQYFQVTFFDVGQGDSIFIETPQGNQIVIDGGPSSAVLEKLGRKMPFWDRTIDLVILTHPERDHITGLLDILKRYHVENVLWTGVLRDTAEYREWRRLLEEEQKEGASILLARRGQKVTCEKCRSQQWALEILSPVEAVANREVEKSNNTSIVTRLMFGQTSFLFTGDIESPIERELLLERAGIDATILKVAHHGSKTSSIPQFIAAVSPELAVISVGRNNRYGHPHPSTLATLERNDAKILRTDERGDITITSDGVHYAIR